MSTPKEVAAFLETLNAWRRGDETIEMPSPAKIGATIDDAVSLLRKYDTLERRVKRLSLALKRQERWVEVLQEAAK